MPVLNGAVVGIWGIGSAETAQGIIIKSIKETSRTEKAYVRNRTGDRVGRSDYDDSIGVSLEGEVLTGDTWDQKIAAALTLTNTVSLALINPVGPGDTLIDEVECSRGQEEWEMVKVEAEVLPYFT
jgi:hypothetical protein